MDSQIKKSTKSHLNSFDKLPHETLLEILSRLPVKSLIQFSFTHKPLKSLIRDPHLVNLHLSRSDGSYLIIHSDYPLRNGLHFLQLSEDKLCKFEMPFAKSMPEFSVLGSSNGLLCLINTLFNESISFYNPFTKDHFELPKNYDSRHQVVFHGFGFDPVSHDYKVVKIAYYRGTYFRHRNRELTKSKQGTEVMVYSRRSNMWLYKGPIPYRLERWSSLGVLVGRSLHWMSVWGIYDEGCPQRVVVSYDLVDEKFLTIKSPCSGCDYDSSRRWASCHLATLNGYLCVSVPVPSGCGSFDIWMMKEYGVEKSWVKEYSVGVYYPVSMLSSEMVRSPGIWRNIFVKKMVKVLCVLEGGEVVLEYRGGGLVAYDPHKKSFKELEYEGMPRIYQAFVHVGSLVSTTLVDSIDTTFKSISSTT